MRTTFIILILLAVANSKTLVLNLDMNQLESAEFVRDHTLVLKSNKVKNFVDYNFVSKRALEETFVVSLTGDGANDMLNYTFDHFEHNEGSNGWYDFILCFAEEVIRTKEPNGFRRHVMACDKTHSASYYREANKKIKDERKQIVEEAVKIAHPLVIEQSLPFVYELEGKRTDEETIAFNEKVLNGFETYVLSVKGDDAEEIRKEEEAKRIEEQRKEEERKQKELEEAKKREEEAKKLAEEAKKREEEAKKKEEEERSEEARKEKEAAERDAAEKEKQRRIEEEKRKKAEEEVAKAEEERKRREEARKSGNWFTNLFSSFSSKEKPATFLSLDEVLAELDEE